MSKFIVSIVVKHFLPISETDRQEAADSGCHLVQGAGAIYIDGPLDRASEFASRLIGRHQNLGNL